MNSSIQVLAFGQLTDIIGKQGLVIENVLDVDQLKKLLEQRFPSLASAKFQVAVNAELVKGNAELNPGDVVGLLPPFSGG